MPAPRWVDDDTTIFASPAWFEHWFAAFAPGEHGFYTSAGGEPFTLAYSVETRRVGRLPIRVARAAANSFTPQFDVTGPGTPGIGDLRAMMKELGASTLVLPFVAPYARLLRRVDTASPPAGTFVDFCESAPIIDCSSAWDDYLATRRKSRRDEWRDKEQRVRKAGGRFHIASDWREVEPDFEEILDVEASGWKGRGGSAIRNVPAAHRFFSGLCRDLATAGKLRVFAVRTDERILAFKICALHAGRVSSLKTGFREEYGKLSPGLVLQLWTTRWCFEQPSVGVFDFLGPVAPNKLPWSTTCETLSTLYVFRATPPGSLGWLRWSVAPRLRARFKALTPATAAAADAP